MKIVFNRPKTLKPGEKVYYVNPLVILFLLIAAVSLPILPNHQSIMTYEGE